MRNALRVSMLLLCGVACSFADVSDVHQVGQASNPMCAFAALSPNATLYQALCDMSPAAYGVLVQGRADNPASPSVRITVTYTLDSDPAGTLHQASVSAVPKYNSNSMGDNFAGIVYLANTTAFHVVAIEVAEELTPAVTQYAPAVAPFAAKQ